MCFYVVTYTDWQCGYRQNTGRHRVSTVATDVANVR